MVFFTISLSCLIVSLAPKANTNGTVLVLISMAEYFLDWYPAMLISPDGEQEQLGCYEWGDSTEADESCSINWQNQLYIFGGSQLKRQISKLNGHKMERVGSLAFDHDYGSCSVMNNQFIYLCFGKVGESDSNGCRWSTGPLESFSETALSNYEHRDAKTGCADCKSLVQYLIHTSLSCPCRSGILYNKKERNIRSRSLE